MLVNVNQPGINILNGFHKEKDINMLKRKDKKKKKTMKTTV